MLKSFLMDFCLILNMLMLITIIIGAIGAVWILIVTLNVIFVCDSSTLYYEQGFFIVECDFEQH